MDLIQSRQNEKIKLARSLWGRKSREAEGLFIVEGVFHLGEALAAKADIEYVLCAPDALKGDFSKALLDEIESKQIGLFQIDKELLDSLSGREKSSGLIAVCKSHYSDLNSLQEESNALVALIAPQDPGNVGSILRTIDAAEMDGLILVDGGVDAFHPSAVRAGMGAHFWKAIVRSSFAEFSEWAKEKGYAIIGSSAKMGARMSRIQPSEKSILLLGSERSGLSDEQLAICDQVVQLPMRGRSSSLNLSVAAGILIYGLRENERGD